MTEIISKPIAFIVDINKYRSMDYYMKNTETPALTTPKKSYRFQQDILRPIVTLNLTLGLGAIALLLNPQTIQAQETSPLQTQAPRIIPVPEPPPPPELPTPAPLPPPEELLPPAVPTPEPPDTLPDVSDTLIVEQFVFEGNTAFSDEELAEVTAPFTGRPVTFAELLQARSAVTELYVTEGYITSGALIPPQPFDGGIVTIQIVEGVVEAINITGNRRLNASYVRGRLRLGAKTPLNQNRLLEALQLLQLNPLIENVSAELAASPTPGQSVLEITISEAKTFRLDATFDNNRVPSVGSFRRGATLSEANLLGLGDGISISYTNTDGSDALDVDYTVPINPRNGTISFRFGLSDSEIIEEPFDQVNIEAESRTYELTYRQPILEKPTGEIALGITAARRESETSLLGVDFPLSPGADDEGRTRLSIVRFFQDFIQRGERQVLAARSQFSFGFDAFDATVSDSEPDGEFFTWRGQAQWVRLLAPDTLLVVRSDLQLTPDEIVPLEQIGVGGQQTVRGYRQDALLTDNAILASVELRYPIVRTNDGEGLLQVTPFVDFGTAWNNGDRPDPDPNTLVSVGLGLRFQYSENLSIRFDWGIPLVDVDSNERTWQENGLYFSVEINPF